MNAQLRHAARLLPHLHDGGGFFVCLIQRRAGRDSANAAATAATAAEAAAATAAAGAAAPGKAAHNAAGEQPWAPSPAGVLSPVDGGRGGAPWAELASFYGLSDDVLGRRRAHAAAAHHLPAANAAAAAADATAAGLGEEGPRLLAEGPRVVLCSAGLAQFLAALQAAAAVAAAAGGSGHHPGASLHSAGLRVFLKMSDGAFRSAAACR